MSRKKLSLIVPVYYEEEVISQFIKETGDELRKLDLDYEVVFTDDGSKDRTVEIIKEHAQSSPWIKLVELSYNHGKQAAFTAGLTHATGDYFIYMDPDLQDPPVEIPRFIAELEKGYDLVFGLRKEKKDSIINVLFSNIFWWVLNKFSGLEIPRGIAVMRIFNRKFADKFLEYKEQNRFIEGIFMHIGMKRTEIYIEQRERFAGVSKFNFKRKMRLAFDAIFDFSELPLKLSIKFGVILVLISLLGLLGIVLLEVTVVDFQAGWPSMIGAILLGTGLQIFFTGIVALYIGRIYKESKSRPLFSMKETTNIEHA